MLSQSSSAYFGSDRQLSSGHCVRCPRIHLLPRSSDHDRKTCSSWLSCHLSCCSLHPSPTVPLHRRHHHPQREVVVVSIATTDPVDVGRQRRQWKEGSGRPRKGRLSLRDCTPARRELGMRALCRRIVDIEGMMKMMEVRVSESELIGCLGHYKIKC